MTTTRSPVSPGKIQYPTGRNLYIPAANLFVFALISRGISFTNIAQQPGSLGDAFL